MIFSDKCVIITGGGSGIGKACASLFQREGAYVWILGRNEEKLEKACRELNEVNNSEGEVQVMPVMYLAADIAKVSECERAVKFITEKNGRIDVLVNCAGTSTAGSSLDVTEEMWDRMVDTNLKGTFFMCRYALPELIKSKGNIVNISSDAGVVGNKELAVYCASKGGVTVMTKSLALEFAEKGVRVNSVCPTETDTPMMDVDAIEYGYGSKEEFEKQLQFIFPQGENARFVKAEEVAESVLFLADNRKAAAITGTALMVDFGMTAGY